MTVKIHERREVIINGLPDDCISRTPRGRSPIRCDRAVVLYDLNGGKLSEVTVWGYLTEQSDIDRRARSLRSYGKERADGVIVRSYRVDWDSQTADLPKWLDELVEEYRPAGGAR